MSSSKQKLKPQEDTAAEPTEWLNSQSLAVPPLIGMLNKWKTHIFLAGMQNGIENGLAFSYKCKHIPII